MIMDVANRRWRLALASPLAVLCTHVAGGEASPARGATGTSGHAASFPAPLLQPLIVSAHRAGGRVFAPDNSEPNIEHAVAIGVNMIEVDLRPTADGGLVLWHDATAPRALFFPDDASNKQKVAFASLTRDDVKGLCYSQVTRGRTWTGLTVVDAEAMIERYKDRLNFHLDVKSTPAERLLRLISEHDIRDQVIVMSKNLQYLRKIKAADPNIICEWPNNTLGRYEVDGKWVFYPMARQLEEYRSALEKLREAGIEMLCTKGLNAEKVRLCHEYGVAVRPSASHVTTGDGAKFLAMGVDGLLCDNPQAVMTAVKVMLGPRFLPRPGQTVAEIFRSRRVARP